MSATAAAVGEQVLRFTRELRWEAVPHHVRRHLALALLDHVAVCEAGRSAPASLIAADYASEVHAGDRATALVDGRRLSAPGAAWANGVLANVLDYDDGHRITKGHPGAMVIPAALATAEAVNASATAFLEAVLVGYEVALRAGVLIHEREAQYHASASWGALGVAASVGRLLGLCGDELRHAIGIAEYHAPIALMPRAVNDPAMTKDTTGWGAFMGTSSAMLAARGFTGLDSEFMQASEELDLGSRWDVLELYLKPYPCCRWSQPGIDAALRMRAEGLDPGRIAAIEVRTFAAAEDLAWRRPRNTEEMQYSLAWPVATALARGRFGVDEVLTGFDDAGAARLVERMRLTVDPELTARFPARRLTELVVELDDGTVLRSGAVEAGGEPGADDWEDVVGDKVRAFLDADAALPVAAQVTAPAGVVAGRSREALVGLLAFGLPERRRRSTA